MHSTSQEPSPFLTIIHSEQSLTETVYPWHSPSFLIVRLPLRSRSLARADGGLGADLAALFGCQPLIINLLSDLFALTASLARAPPGCRAFTILVPFTALLGSNHRESKSDKGIPHTLISSSRVRGHTCASCAASSYVLPLHLQIHPHVLSSSLEPHQIRFHSESHHRRGPLISVTNPHHELTPR